MSLKTAAIYSAIAIATLVAAELLVRGYVWSPKMNAGVVSDGLGIERYYHSYDGFGDLVPNQDGHWVIWFHRPYHVQTNSVGLRNTEEPLDQAFRIYAVGDSQTFGPYLANDDTWPAWTENYLRQKLGRADTVQVFNAGISGYTIRDEFALLRDKGVGFRPNLVLLAVYENDLGDLARPQPQRPDAGVDSRLTLLIKKVVRSSALASLANELRTSMQFSAAGVDIRAGERVSAGGDKPDDERSDLRRRYSELFRATVELLRANRIRVAVIFIPDVGAVAHGTRSQMSPVVEALSRESRIPFLDLTDAVRSSASPAEGYLLQYDVKRGELTGNGHLSRQGTAIIGKAVADWLSEQGLVAVR